MSSAHSNCLHDFKIVKGTSAGVMEVCRLCKAKILTRQTKNGIIDNKAYRELHKRDLAQPGSKEFLQAYGTQALTPFKVQKKKKKSADEYKLIAEEMYKAHHNV